MRDRDTVVFVEVKTLRDRRMMDPEDALRPPQRRRLTKTARWFLHHKRWDDQPCRFDLVTVVLPEDGQPEIEHHPDAFLPSKR